MTLNGCVSINTGGILLTALKVRTMSDPKAGYILDGVKKSPSHPILPKAIKSISEPLSKEAYRQSLLGVYDILPRKDQKDQKGQKDEDRRNSPRRQYELMEHAIANTPWNIRHLLWKEGKGFHPVIHPLHLPMPNTITSMPNHLRKFIQALEISKPYFKDHGRELLRKGASIVHDRFFASDEKVRLAAARNIMFVRQSMGMFKKIRHENRILGYYLFSLRHIERKLNRLVTKQDEVIKARPTNWAENSHKFIQNWNNSDESLELIDKIKGYRIQIEMEVFKNCVKVVFSPHAPDLGHIIKYYVSNVQKYHLSSDIAVRNQARKDLDFLRDTCNTMLMWTKL